ncbi:hypothetical protein [Nocardioides psychrotolerans]|uniref:hypothetical protein n=1 Tax=Nocardioides psychrotolerans TaxID=1005945 RepID=UPI0031378955
MNRRGVVDLLADLRQPDRLSCGASVLVAARMLTDPAYARLFAPGDDRPAAFAREVLDLHRRVTGARDLAGRPQPPWPRAIGTPPWAVSRHLTVLSGVRHQVRLVRPGPAVDDEVGRVRAALAADHPVALFVGTRWLPRHVVLVTGASDDAWQVYEPASGRVVEVPLTRLRAHTLGLAGWDRPWFVVRPRRVRPPARRSPA